MKIRTLGLYVLYGAVSAAGLYLTFNPNSGALIVLCLVHGVVFGWLGDVVDWVRRGVSR